VIVSFGDAATGDLYHGHATQRVRRFPANVANIALRKLDVLNSAHQLEHLRMPPGNRPKALKGGMEGFHSIRVNDQRRLVFRWSEGGAREVLLTDYH
jgi:toxin HigB-1